MKDLNGKHVLITGAAQGIGEAMAYEFAKRGCPLILVDINEGKLLEVARSLEGRGCEVWTIVADLSKTAGAEAVIDDALDKCVRIDVLVNNAGVVFGGPVQDATTAQIETMLDVNLLAPILTTRRVIPHMVDRGSGHIVNICSLAGRASAPNVSVYCSSKGGLISYTDAIMQELYGTGVATTVVSPNFVSTGLFDGCKKHPLWQWTTPEEVARRVVRAVEKNQAEIYVPSYMWIWSVIRAVCMAKFGYFLGRVVGAQVQTGRWRGGNQIQVMGSDPET